MGVWLALCPNTLTPCLGSTCTAQLAASPPGELCLGQKPLFPKDRHRQALLPASNWPSERRLKTQTNGSTSEATRSMPAKKTSEPAFRTSLSKTARPGWTSLNTSPASTVTAPMPLACHQVSDPVRLPPSCILPSPWPHSAIPVAASGTCGQVTVSCPVFNCPAGEDLTHMGMRRVLQRNDSTLNNRVEDLEQERAATNTGHCRLGRRRQP